MKTNDKNELKSFIRTHYGNTIHFKYRNFNCMIINGFVPTTYVAVTKDHPYFGKDYACVDDLPVNGGLTFSSMGVKTMEEPYERPMYSQVDKQEGPLYWFGWDYGHSWNFTSILQGPLNSKVTPEQIAEDVHKAVIELNKVIGIEFDEIEPKGTHRKVYPIKKMNP